VGSGFKECELMNGFKPWMQEVQSNAEKSCARFVAAKSEHIDQI